MEQVSTASRVAVLETRVDGIREDIHELKTDIKEVNVNVDSNKVELKEQLEKMYNASCDQHAALAKEIKEIKEFKNKWVYMTLGGIAVFGWISGHWDKFNLLFK